MSAAGATPPRRVQHLARHVVRRGLPDQVVEVGDDEVGIAGGEPLEHGVEHVGRLVTDRVPEGLATRRRYAYTAPVASPAKAAANAGMSWVRTPATARLGIGSSGRAPWWYRLNCSS